MDGHAVATRPASAIERELARVAPELLCIVDERKATLRRTVESILDNDGVACHEQARCVQCGGAGSVLYSGLRDAVLSAPGSWALRRCRDRSCGLVWLDPMPLPSETGKFYAGYYTHAATGQRNPTATRPSLKSRAKSLLATVLYWRRYAFLTELLHLQGMTPGKLLEIGCGAGYFLEQAAVLGWRPVGIDFDANAIAAAREIPDVEAFAGDLLSMKFPDATFDAIAMNNVIEHLPDPDKVFPECQRILKPGGRLVMVTPSTSSLGHKHFGRDWRGLEVPRHLHLFAPRNLRQFAKAAKFRRVDAFTSAGGAQGILSQSQAIRDARLGGTAPKSARIRNIIRRELVGILLGRDVGEWAVLVAHK